MEFARQVLSKNNIQDQELILSTKIATAFHDIGKADKRFQEYLIGKKIKVYHPLLGLPVIEEITKNLPQNLQCLIILAVASHHTPLHKDLYSFADYTQTLDVENKLDFEQIINNLLFKIDIEFNGKFENCYNKSCKKVFNEAKFNFSPSSLNDKIQFREKFIIIQGILNYCDWLLVVYQKSQRFILRNSLSLHITIN